MFNIYFKEMKKFFSLIALVGVFAACNPEDLTTYFTVTPATVTLTANALCAAPGFSESDATYTPSKVQTVSGTEAAPSIAPGQFTVSASYGGVSSPTETVAYPRILGGANASLSVNLTIPYSVSGYTISIEKAESESEYTWKCLPAAAHGHGIATQTVEYEGEEYEIPMLENANEFTLTDTYTFVSYAGSEVVPGSKKILKDDFAAHVDNAWDNASANEIVETEIEKEFTVSAWAIYNVLGVIETVTETYNVVATPDANNPSLEDGGVVGSFQVRTKNSGSQFFEFAHPDHASHYEAGHGHGHGNGSNAGGGLVEQDAD